MVHLFVYDDVWFSPLPLTGLPKTGAIRARFLTEGVQDLRAQLRQRGHELLVRRGSSAEEIGKLVGRLGVRHVHAYSEVRCLRNAALPHFAMPLQQHTHSLQHVAVACAALTAVSGALPQPEDPG